MQTIYTIGHSTRSLEVFFNILKSCQFELLVDVRSIPRSRHTPQFNLETLEKAVIEKGIEFVWLKELGGLRHSNQTSINTGWRNASFRGYADYMQTVEFEMGIARLIALAVEKRAAIMCAEALPWRCHRSLIGDALLMREFKVIDIFDETTAKPHLLTKWAKVEGEKIWYPKENGQGALFQ